MFKGKDWLSNVGGRNERVLITAVQKKFYTGWHPTLGEFDLATQGGKTESTNKERCYEEADVLLRIKSFVPLQFESKMRASVVPEEEKIE